MEDVLIGDKVIAKKRVRNKIIHNEKLRLEFLTQLNNILNLNDNNNIVYMAQLTHPDLQRFIEDNEDTIKACFKYNNWSWYKKSRSESRLIHVLIKNIYKHEQYTIYTKKVTLRDENDKPFICCQFIFYKPGSIL